MTNIERLIFGVVYRAIWDSLSVLRKLWRSLPWIAGSKKPLSQIEEALRPGTWTIYTKPGRVRMPRPAFARNADLTLSSPLFTQFAPDAPQAVLRGSHLVQARTRRGSAHAKAGFSADLVIPRESSGKLLLVDSQARIVAHRTREYPADYQDLRKHFARFVSSTPFEWSNSLRAAIEPIVPGAVLSSHEPPFRTQVRKRILKQLADLCADKTINRQCAGHSAEALTTWLPEARQRRSDILDLIDGAPLVVSHGDLWDTNVVITKENDFFITDFDTISMRPFWRDCCSLILEDMLGFSDGIFDREIEEIWRASGLVPPHFCQDTRRLLLLLSISAVISFEVRRLHPGSWRWRGEVQRHTKVWQTRLEGML